MAYVCSFPLAGRLVEVTASQHFDIASASFVRLVGELQTFFSVGISAFEFKQTQADPLVYKYEFIHNDGRQWKSTIRFDALANDPKITFNVPDGWRITEYALHRAVRDSCIGLRNSNGVTRVVLI